MDPEEKRDARRCVGKLSGKVLEANGYAATGDKARLTRTVNELVLIAGDLLDKLKEEKDETDAEVDRSSQSGESQD